MKTLMCITVMCTLILFLPDTSSAQFVEGYIAKIDSANVLLNMKKFSEAGTYFSKAFELNNNLGRINDRYNAAQAWSLAGIKDSAFIQLNKLAAANYNEDLKVVTDTAFINLRHDARWKDLVVNFKANRGAWLMTKYAKLNGNSLALAGKLDSIYYDDQLPRLQLPEKLKYYAWSSTEMKEHLAKMSLNDSLNTSKISAILDKYGWSEIAGLGDEAVNTVFLVIQHADLKTQLNFLPTFKQAALKGYLSPSSIALFEDRIAVRQGKKQVYGTQLMMNNKTGKYFVQAIENPEKVNERRAAVGLPPMEEYVRQWGITWSLQQYYKDLEDNKIHFIVK
jgi:hypothetical protein